MAAISFQDVPVPPSEITQYFGFGIFQELGERVVRAMQLQSSNERLSETEAEQLNATIRQDIQNTFDKLSRKVSDALEVTPGETPEAAQIKLVLIGRSAKFIEDLSIWLIDKISSIISRIKEGFLWCWQKTQELFQYLQTMLLGY